MGALAWSRTQSSRTRVCHSTNFANRDIPLDKQVGIKYTHKIPSNHLGHICKMSGYYACYMWLPGRCQHNLDAI